MTKSALRVAIVGSGPAGMYAAAHLLGQSDIPVEIDVIDRLPTPWGLVRAGVAPDHPEKKLVTDVFESIAARPGFRFFGNIEVGRDIAHEQLASWYSGVIYAVGALSDRSCGIPGESLPGSHSATEFVGWYNGHPDFRDRQFDLSHDRAIIIGNGNVALDIARILCLPVDSLQKTDMAGHALEALRHSQIREIVILGRRSPLQAAFNNPELSELEELDGVSLAVRAEDLPDLAAQRQADWVSLRKVQTLQRWAQHRSSPSAKKIAFRFYGSPVEVLGRDRAEGLLVSHNRLEVSATGALEARSTGETETISAGLVLRAVGYRGLPIPGVPFDEDRGIIPNMNGRVDEGVYATGWIKRGPSGIIGLNKACAKQTVDGLFRDAHQLLRKHALSADQVATELQSRRPTLTRFAGWQAIDLRERQLGRATDRPKLKLSGMDELLSTTIPASVACAR